jgi:hypothetical protein
MDRQATQLRYQAIAASLELASVSRLTYSSEDASRWANGVWLLSNIISKHDLYERKYAQSLLSTESTIRFYLD